MKPRYRLWFWITSIADLALLAIILVTGPAAFNKVQQGDLQIAFLEPAILPTATLQPVAVQVILPENVIEERDFPLTVTITNRQSKSIILHSLVLPRAFMDNMTLIQLEPPITQHISTEAGEEYFFEEDLNPNEETTFIFILRANKMQALTGDIIIKSNQGETQQSFMMAVAPGGQAQPYVDPAFPYQALVKITGLYEDGNGILQTGWSGIGSLISSDGLILTNAHLVLPNRSLPVDELMVSIIHSKDSPPQDSYYAKVLQADYYLDLAVIKINTDLQGKKLDSAGLNLPFVELGQDKNDLGKRLSILGLPLSGKEWVTQISGDISGFTAQNPYGDRAFIQTSAIIPASFSGGMALDEHGRLMAIPVLNVSPKGEIGIGECRFLSDTNSDRLINSKDLCMPPQGVIAGLRSISLAIPMIEAAKRGESRILNYPHDLIEFPDGSKLLLEDNFNDQASGWVNSNPSARYGEYLGGAYQISVKGVGDYGLGFFQDKKFTDEVMSVHVKEVSPADDAFYGIVCRYTNLENYYLFAVTTDGRYSIQKVENNQFSVLVPWSYSPIIPVNEEYEISTACVGRSLSLAVNGIPLTQINNASHWRGFPGLVAGTFNSDHFAVGFDDLVIKAP